MIRLMQVLARLESDDRVRTTWPQLATALGLPTHGLRTQDVIDRYSTRIRNTMGYLVDTGLVGGWEVVYDGREPTGILVTLRAGVAQLVRASRVRSTMPPRRPFFSGQVGQPPGGVKGGSGNSVVSGPRDRSSARARRALGTRDRAQLGPDVRAALEELEESGTEAGGLGALRRVPWLRWVPPAVLLREAVRVYPLSSIRSLALSLRWEEQLDRAVALLDRVHGAGAGRAELLALAWGMRGYGPGGGEHQPYSLGGFAVLLKKRARKARRKHGARKLGLADHELARLQAKGLA